MALTKISGVRLELASSTLNMGTISLNIAPLVCNREQKILLVQLVAFPITLGLSKVALYDGDGS